MSGAALNDGTRGMMAAAAKYRDDNAGAIVTGGSVNAYSVSSFQGFDTLAHLSGQVVAFSPHVTNTGACTVTIDGLGVKPLRPSPGVDFIGGELIQGTPYTALYNNATGEVYVRGYVTSPYAVPIAAGLDFWGPTAPNSAFAFPTGQAISRATYAKLFALIGTTYGVGDGSTTFNLPDKVGRVSAMLDAGSARLSASFFGGNPANLGASGGGESKTLLTANLPPYTPAGSITNGAITSMTNNISSGTGGGTLNLSVGGFSGTGTFTSGGSGFSAVQAASSFAGTAQGGSSTPIRTVQPTIVCNYIMRVL